MKDKINIITSSKYHDGNFGHEVDIQSILHFTQGKQNLSSYVNFLTQFGYGELDASFFIEAAPAIWSDIYPKERNHLDGLYIFATNQGEYTFAFDKNNSCKVVEIDASGIISDTNFGFFNDFISDQLDRLIEIVRWREDNL